MTNAATNAPQTEPSFVPFDEPGGLIFSTTLPGSGVEFERRRAGGWGVLTTGDADGPVWIHLDRTRPHAQQWLREEARLEPVVIESLLAEQTRPSVHLLDEGLLVILRGVNMNAGAEPDDLIAIRMWIDAARAITLRQFRFRTVARLREDAANGRAPESTGGLLAAIARGLSSGLSESVVNLEQLLDEIEENLLNDAVEDDPNARAKLANIRRQAITYRRFLVPQREALMRLTALDSPLLSARDLIELRVAAEQAARAAEAFEEIRDRAAVTQDEIRARHEARISRTLYLLTIVATIALPLGLITGLLGINVGGLPMADSPLGFTVVCLLLAGLGAAELALFRYMRWL